MPRKRHLGFESLEPRCLLSASSPIPLAGDWDGDAVDSFGYYNPQWGTFLIHNESTSGFPERAVRFGPKCSDYVPIVGDWDGDGVDTPGLYDAKSGTFFLKNDLSAGKADIKLRYGPKGRNWQPLSGDWDGDGRDTLGLYDPAESKFYLKNSLSPGAADAAFRFGRRGESWLPLAGDWDQDGADTVGVYDRQTSRFYLKNSLAGGVADETFSYDAPPSLSGYGPTGVAWQALVGDFDGNSTVTVALVEPGTGKISVQDTRGSADSWALFVAPLLDRGSPGIPSSSASGQLPPAAPAPPLTPAEVEQLLERAAAASASEGAIIAVVDRGGHILGVRAEADVLATITDTETLVFAIDGAVAKARTAAFFANGDPDNGTLAPLNSRLVRFISQSTVTQREVDANPNSSDPAVRGPGFVAPIGLGGHFPPEVAHTPVVDLFAIEHTNRDGIVHPGPDLIRQTPTLDASGNVTGVSGDDILLPSRFNVDPAFIAPGQQIDPPESYGLVSGLFTRAQSRGIATLPGGVPLYKDSDGDGLGDTLVGGIGVFFPGPDGYASYEQGFVPGIGQTEAQRTNAPRVLEAEWIAFAAAGGSRGAGAAVGALNGVPRVAGFDLPFGRLTLVGIELEVFGPHPDGVWTVVETGNRVGRGDPGSGADQPVHVDGTLYLPGEVVPEGWLVLPHGSAVDDISAADVARVINQGIAEATRVRAAVRLPMSSRTRMVFSVTDTQGNVLGLYRMKDATFFSIDVATAKARNTAYYADAAAIVDVDRVDQHVPPDGVPDVAAGVAFTNRTFRFLAEARYPSGVDNSAPGPFSILFDPGINRRNAENTGGPTDASLFTSVLGFDAFNPGSNFRDPDNIANQNGVVFFPGSTPLYKRNGTLVGGFGVSGDGVDQDDVVTFFGARGFLPPSSVERADDVFVRRTRLPYLKFLRNPEG